MAPPATSFLMTRPIPVVAPTAHSIDDFVQTLLGFSTLSMASSNSDRQPRR